MPQSLSAVYLHIVYSTKHRLPLITADLAPRLDDYVGGIARGNKVRGYIDRQEEHHA